MVVTFPSNFVVGCATAAYQVEGAWNEDGKGESIWDRFAHTPGRIERDENGDVACDHYHLYKNDVAMMKSMGLGAYRFSIAWTRILPDGKGKISQKGIDFYSRLTDELLGNGITPFATLFHWDFPQALMEKYAGWVGRDCAYYFADYAAIVFDKLGDRIKNWITHNEPKNVHLLMGYVQGHFAPGLRVHYGDFLLACHNMLLAHGLAVRALRESGRPGQIGISLDADVCEPGSESPGDISAAARAIEDRVFWCIDPIYKGKYPAIAYSNELSPFMPPNFEKDLPAIAAPVDFLGINSYRKLWVEFDEREPAGFTIDSNHFPPGVQRTEYGWPITPEGIYEILSLINNRVPGISLYVTENGYGGTKTIGGDGKVHDHERIDFLKKYLFFVKKAIDEGIRVQGYFHWSLMDNFEWASGFRPRFGLVAVDYATQRRVWKDSAYWYRQYCSAKAFDYP